MAVDEHGVPQQVSDNADAAMAFMKGAGGDTDTSGAEEAAAAEAGETATGEDGTPVGEPAPEASDDTPPAGDDDLTWEQRYKSIQGKYDKEVPRLHEELRDFKERVFNKVLSAEPPVKQDTPPVEDPEVTKAKEAVNAKIEAYKEEFGEEALNANRELFNIWLDEALPERIAPVSQEVDSVREAQIQTARQNFSTAVLDKFSEIEGAGEKVINILAGQDPKFLEFCKQPDPSGLYTYGDLVNAYNTNWEAEKMALVFKTYLEGTGQLAAATPAVKETETPAATPTPETPPKKETAEALIAPNRSTETSTPAADDKIIWTEASILEFQRNDRKGNVYTPEESKALWDDFLLAPAEGRIVQG